MAGKKVTRICDEVIWMLDDYEALAQLAFAEGATSSSVIVLLDSLNRQLRCIVHRMNEAGMGT